MPLVAVSGDTDHQAATTSHKNGIITPVPVGEDTPSIPESDQGFVHANGKLVITKGQAFSTGCPIGCGATAGDSSPCSTLTFIAGIPICRAGDKALSEGSHNFDGIAVAGQSTYYDSG